MTEARIVVLGDESLAASLMAAGQAAEVGMRQAVSNAADLALTKIRANASGRPGPNAPTGDYRRSWTRQTQRSSGAHALAGSGSKGGAYSVSVGTNRPQARRLEFGFVGADSLGRVYHQPAYPHVEPAIGPVLAYFTEEMDKVRAMIVSGGSLRIGPAIG